MRRILIVVAALALVAAACGGDDGDEAGPTAATGPTEETAATGPTEATGAECVDLTGEGDVFTIRISGFAYVPACFTASASQGITVINEDGALHSFTLEDTQIDVDVEPGTEFNGEPISGAVEPGTYRLFCKYHAGLTGEVTVVA